MDWIKTKDERPLSAYLTILIWYNGDYEFGVILNDEFYWHDNGVVGRCKKEPECWCRLPPSLDKT